AGAARVWHPALTITPRGADPWGPSAAAGTGGEALAAFTNNIGGRSRVEARTRDDARSAWVPVVLSGTFPRAPSPPAAAIDTAGRAVVVWHVRGGTVRAAVRDRPGGGWRVVPVADGRPTDQSLDFRGAVAAMDGRDSSATVIWAERAGGAWTVRSARRPGPGAAWTETPGLALDAGASEPSINVTPDGTAVAAWSIVEGDAPFATGAVKASVRRADGVWTGVQTLAAAGARAPSAAAGYDGRAAVAWEDRTVPGTTTVTVAEAALGSVWGPAAPVAAGEAPRIAENANGDLALTWASPGTPQATPILVSLRPAAQPWGAPAVLTDGEGLTWVEASLARVAVGGTGRAFVAWLDAEGPGSATAYLAAARPGETWARGSVPVGGDEYAISLSASSGGNGLAVLPAESGDGRAVKASDYDGYLRPVVTAGLAGKRRADGTVGWTAVIRNRGRVTAQGVTLRLAVCCGARLVSASPPGVRAGLQVDWKVANLRPGRTATVRLTVRHPAGSTGRLAGSVRATAAPPVFVAATARR
ncbi:MAG: hypothetical protein AB7I08_20030, partial [Thermoleophilia bacterium]